MSNVIRMADGTLHGSKCKFREMNFLDAGNDPRRRSLTLGMDFPTKAETIQIIGERTLHLGDYILQPKMHLVEMFSKSSLRLSKKQNLSQIPNNVIEVDEMFYRRQCPEAIPKIEMPENQTKPPNLAKNTESRKYFKSQRKNDQS